MGTTSGESRGAIEPTSAAPGSSLPEQLESKLPDEPVVVIQPRGAWGIVDLRELWSYRELLYFLTWRDVKVRYKQTILGAAWALLQPVFTMLIFTLIFSRIAKISSDDVPYPIFAYAALIPWIFFANAATTGGNSIVGSSNLITKVYFPRILIPAAAVGAGIVDFAIAFLMLIPLLIYYQIEPHPSMLMLPLPIAMIVLLALGVGVLLAALNVKYRDIRFAVPFLVQIWMFLSPVAYPSSAVPEKWQLLYSLNPVVGIVDAFRSALFGLPFNWGTIGISAAITAALLVYASVVFRRMEKTFADII